MSEEQEAVTKTRSASRPVNRDISSTFVKGLTVLRVFDDTHTRLTLAEISNLAGVDSASARRLVLTLVHLGYVQKDGRHFSLSPKILILAGSFLRGNQFGTHIQPLLNRFASKIGATVSLAMRDGDKAVYIAQSTIPDENVTFGFTVGSRLPLLHSAIGRMILAYADPEETAEIINTTEFRCYTANTEMDRAAIARAVQLARERGYSHVHGEFEAGVSGYSVPIGSIGALKAVVGISQTGMVQDEAQMDEIVASLQALALDLKRTRIFGDGFE